MINRRYSRLSRCLVCLTHSSGAEDHRRRHLQGVPRTRLGAELDKSFHTRREEWGILPVFDRRTTRL